MACISIRVKRGFVRRMLAKLLNGIEIPEVAREIEVVVMDGLSHRKCLAELNRRRRPPVLLMILSPNEGLAGRTPREEIEDGRPVSIKPRGTRAGKCPLLPLRSLSGAGSDWSDAPVVNAKLTEDEMSKNTAPLRDAFIETVRLLVKATEYRDEQTGGHIERTSYYCKHLAAALGADREFQDRIFFAAPMHDVGKIGIPDAILLKPGTLHGEELAIMRSHAELGEHMLSAGSSPYLQMGMTVAGGHHERWDGSGYPRGLKGEEIPLPARIMAVADIYDALRSRRPYKAAIDHETTVDIIRKGDGRTLPGHFDPEIMNVFSKEASAFRDIYDSYS